MKNMASIYSISRLLPVDHLDDYPFCHRIGFSCRTKNIHNKENAHRGDNHYAFFHIRIEISGD